MSAMFSITGDKKLIKKLEKLKRKDFNKASREGAKIVQKRVRDKAPSRTRKLRRAVKVKALKGRKQAGAKVTIQFPGGGRFYGGFLEFGTVYITARRFMKKAVDQVGQQAVDRVVVIILGEIP